MRREIKNGVLKLKVKEIIKKMRIYLGYAYLIAYVWIGFAIFALIENDVSVVLWSFVPVMLSWFFYSKTTKSRKTLTSLKDTEIQPDSEALLKYSNQLKKNCQDFLCKVKVVILTLDFERDLRTKTEEQLTLICIFSYLFGLGIFVRNLPAENAVYRGIGIFLTTFGIVVFSSLCLLYFKFIKVASESLVRYHITSFVKKNRDHVRSMLALIDPCRNFTIRLPEEAAKQVSAELSKLDASLTEIESSLKGHKRSTTISLASFSGYIASLIAFLYNIYPQFQDGTLQMFSVYGGLVILAVFASLWVFLMTPLSRMQSLLAGFKVTENEKKITEDIWNMMSSSLGKELSEVALESLHILG